MKWCVKMSGRGERENANQTRNRAPSSFQEVVQKFMVFDQDDPLWSNNLLAGGIENIDDGLASQDSRDTQLVRTARLVADGQVEGTDLVVPQGAGGLEDVAQLVVPRDPAVGLRGQTVRHVVHAVGGRERQFPARRLDQAAAVVRGDGLVVHLDAAA